MMKNSIRTFTYIILTIIFTLSCIGKIFGQGHVDITAGVGIPELINFGLRLQLKQAQLGISYGTIPLKDEDIMSISGDFYIHVGGLSELSDRRPWYLKLGVVYLQDETVNWIDKFTYLNLRFGRDINFSKRLGIALEAGILFELNYTRVEKVPPSGWAINIEAPPVLPSTSIVLFYRL